MVVPAGLASLHYDHLEHIFDNLSDEDLVQYDRALQNGPGFQDAVPLYYEKRRFRRINSSLRVTPQNTDFLENELMPMFGESVLGNCEIVHLAMGNTHYATKDDIKIVTKFCNNALRTASKIRRIELAGLIKEHNLALFDHTLFRKRSIHQVYFDCWFYEDSLRTQSALMRADEYWERILDFWNRQDRGIGFYFNMAKLSPEYRDVLANIGANLDNVEVHFY